MSDALQLILNGLVQAIVQHPTFQETLRSVLADAKPDTEELATLRTLYHNAEEDRRDMLRRIDALEVREDGSTYRQFERRIADLENFDLDDAIEKNTFRARNIEGLDDMVLETLESLLSDARISLELSR